MSELAVRRDFTPAEPQQPIMPEDPTGGRLVAWASSLQAAHSIGTALCSTAFVPAHFKGKPEDAAAAILFGDEIGLSPTQALRSVYVISGTPALYARTMVALVLHHGHDVWTVEKTDAKVSVAGKRRGSSHVIEETWSTARASKAGYTNNKKYSTDPQAMLYARAAADVCRQIAPDALAGLAYTVEEIEMAEPEPTTTVRRLEPAKRTARRAQPAPPPEPDLEPPTVTADEPTPTDDEPQPEPTNDEAMITQAQLRMLHPSFSDAGITDRQDRLDYAASIIGRPVESSNDLTKREASQVIDALVKLNEQAAS